MSYVDGGVLCVHPVHVSGPVSERWNLVVLSEGYRYDQLATFVQDVDDLATRFLSTPPLDRLRCHVNIYRVDVWSMHAGCTDPDVPGQCAGTGYDPATFFDSSYCEGGIERLIGVDKLLVEWVLAYYTPWAHETVILVNAGKDGGNGDTYATVAKGSGWDWPKVVIHELGHAAWGLGDEYDFLFACDDSNRHYTGPEPGWPNVAKDVTRSSIKWADLVDPSTPLPTQVNPDCTECNSAGSGYPPETVGAFEGSGLYHCGLYRGQETCIMRYADDFCAVCTEAILGTMAPYAPTCIAPVFPGSSGFLCWFKRVFLFFILLPLFIAQWHPAVNCAYRRLLFRLARCREGNADPCIDLGDGFGLTPGSVAMAYPKASVEMEAEEI